MKTIPAILALLITLASATQAQDSTVRLNDPLFAPAGGILVTTATGMPYVAIGEVAYGFSDRVSVGVVAGLTPIIPGYGIRARVVLSESENWRLYARLPILYYPKTVDLGGDPWLLAWPVVASESRLPSGIRISLQGGIVGAACAESLLGLEEQPATPGGGESELQEHASHAGSGSMEMGFEGNLWNTLGAGVSIPLSSSMTLTTEAHIVLHGLTPAKHDWIGGPPAIIIIGVTKAL